MKGLLNFFVVLVAVTELVIIVDLAGGIIAVCWSVTGGEAVKSHNKCCPTWSVKAGVGQGSGQAGWPREASRQESLQVGR